MKVLILTSKQVTNISNEDIKTMIQEAQPMTQQIGTVATAVFTEDGYTKVVYHDTIVVKFNDNVIELNSNGYRTVTTKVRMNQASNQFDLGYRVYQKNHVWFIDYLGKTQKFIDGIVLPRYEDYLSVSKR